MGYSEKTKGYRLYDLQNNNLFISRDVIFNENDAGKWDNDVDQYPLIIEEEETLSFDSPLDAPLSWLDPHCWNHLLTLLESPP